MSEKTQPQRLLEAVTGEGQNEWTPREQKIRDDMTTEIERLRQANDELFTIKQKTVIANRELKQKLALAEQRAEMAEKAVKAAAEQIEAITKGL